MICMSVREKKGSEKSMELVNVCPLSGKNCSTNCMWYADDDCNLGNLYRMVNRMDDISDRLEEIRDSIDNLNDAVTGIGHSL